MNLLSSLDLISDAFLLSNLFSIHDPLAVNFLSHTQLSVDVGEAFLPLPHKDGSDVAGGGRLNVKLWSAEEPYLYLLTLELRLGEGDQGREVQFESCQVGDKDGLTPACKSTMISVVDIAQTRIKECHGRHICPTPRPNSHHDPVLPLPRSGSVTLRSPRMPACSTTADL